MFGLNKNSTAIAAAVILLGIILYSSILFKPHLENPKTVFYEKPLEKDKKLQLFPGETYRYAYLLNDSQVNITYQVMEGDGCTIIMVQESVNGTSICIDEWGMDSGGSNSTFEDPAFLLFKPWMLSLRPGWTWNSSMYLDYEGMVQHIADSGFRVIRTEDYNGRETFVVEISSTSSPPEYQWIDAEKRVLVKTLGEGYQVELVEGLPDD